MSATKIVLATGLLVALAAGESVWAGGAARTRPSGSGGGGSPTRASGSSSGAGRAPSGGSAPTHASGRATYGYGGGSVVVGGGGWCGGGYPYWYWGGYPYGSWGGYPYGYWGAPYGAWGAWSWPGPYGVGIPLSSEGSEYLPAFVTTDVRPGKATLRLDGEPVGKAKEYRGTWNTLSVSPGEHVLEFEAEGYQTLRLSVDAKAGRAYRINQALQKGTGMDPRSVEPPAISRTTESKAELPPEIESPEVASGIRTGRIRFEMLSPDAAVYLDGEFLGSGRELALLHGAIPVASGEHVVDLVRPGYKGKSVRVNVTEGDPVRVRLELGEGDRE